MKTLSNGGGLDYSVKMAKFELTGLKLWNRANVRNLKDTTTQKWEKGEKTKTDNEKEIGEDAIGVIEINWIEKTNQY